MLDQEVVTVVTAMRMTGEERGWTLHCMELFDHPNIDFTLHFLFHFEYHWRKKINKAQYPDQNLLSFEHSLPLPGSAVVS